MPSNSSTVASSSSISKYHPEVLYDKVRNAPQAIRRVWGFENFHLISGQNKGGVVVTLLAGKISLRFKMMTAFKFPPTAKKNPKNDDRKIGLQNLKYHF